MTNNKYALELFCGTKSFGNFAELEKYSVISLDIESKYNPTILTDILEWDYKQFPVGFFDIIWSSPYSVMQNIHVGRSMTGEELEKKRSFSDKLVIRTFEIIDYFKPRVWYMENPFTSCLKNRDFMQDKDYCIGDYCKYSDWGYKKPTIFFTNKPVSLHRCKRDCDNMIWNDGKPKYHKYSVGGGGATRRTRDHEIHGECTTKTTLQERYRIPEKLLKHLIFT